VHLVILEEEVLVVDDGALRDFLKNEFIAVKSCDCFKLPTLYNIDDISFITLFGQRLPLIYKTRLKPIINFMKLLLGYILQIFYLVNKTPNIRLPRIFVVVYIPENVFSQLWVFFVEIIEGGFVDSSKGVVVSCHDVGGTFAVVDNADFTKVVTLYDELFLTGH